MEEIFMSRAVELLFSFIGVALLCYISLCNRSKALHNGMPYKGVTQRC